jgi:[protein-PII] uridylyltransferase
VRAFVIRDESTVDVVCHDRTGLLAAVTAALESLRIDIVSAIAATWPDDMALSSFRVQNLEDDLNAEELRDRVADYFNTPTQTSGIDGVEITADNQASPWYTILTVEAGDRPGLLHAITAAIAASEGTIHSARVATTPEGKALDTFDLTDRSGAKLTQDSIDAIESAIRNGVAPVRPSRRSMFLRAARGAW